MARVPGALWDGGMSRAGHLGLLGQWMFTCGIITVAPGVEIVSFLENTLAVCN